MNLHRLAGLALLAFAVCGLSVSCKPTTNSSVKTLDNLAAGYQLRTNVCSGDPANYANLDVSHIATIIPGANGATHQALHDEIFLALSSMPQLYIDALSTLTSGKGAYIIATKDVGGICTGDGKLFDSTKEAPIACALSLHKGDIKELPDVGGIVMVVGQSKTAIRHALVKTFAFALVQLVANRLDWSAPNNVVFTPSTFSVLQYELAAGFLEDVLREKKLLSLKVFKDLLGDNVETVIPGNLKNYRAGKLNNLFAGLKTTPDRANQFLDYVTVDAIDSDRCMNWDHSVKAFDANALAAARKTGDLSKIGKFTNTQLIFKNLFPSAFQAYQPVAKYLDNLMRAIAQTSPLPEVRSRAFESGLTLAPRQKSGFNLAGQPSAQKPAVLADAEKQIADFNRGSVPLSWRFSDYSSLQAKSDYASSVMSRPEVINARQEYLRNQQQAQGQTPTVTNQQAENPTQAYIEGGRVGLGEGANNIKTAAVTQFNNAKEAAIRAGDKAGQIYANEGLGGAVSTGVSEIGTSIKEGFNEHIDHAAHEIAAEMDTIDAKYAKEGTGWGVNVSKATSGLPGINPFGAIAGDTEAGRGLEYAGAFAKHLPFIGNGAKSLYNAGAVLSERDPASGQVLTQEQQTAIGKDQAKVSVDATVDAGLAYAAEGTAKAVFAGGERLLPSAVSGLQTTAKGLSNTLADAAIVTGEQGTKFGGFVSSGLTQTASGLRSFSKSLPSFAEASEGFVEASGAAAGSSHGAIEEGFSGTLKEFGEAASGGVLHEGASSGVSPVLSGQEEHGPSTEGGFHEPSVSEQPVHEPTISEPPLHEPLPGPVE